MSLFDIQTIVVPIDFSDESFAAVETAMELVDGDASKVHLIHVLPDLSPADPGVIWAEINDENRAKHVEEAVRERLSDAKYARVNVDVAFGNAGFRIADHARSIRADLIVIPSHGRTGIERLLIGSVAERVIQHSHCPVLVLRSVGRSSTGDPSA